VRRLAAIVVAACALALPGCGGGNGAKSPLDEALGHLPKNAPFAVAISTNLDSGQYKAVDSILGRFPLGGQLKGRLKSQIERGGVDFDEDIRPILGNEFVIGADSVQSANANRFVGAIEAKDEGKLKDLVEKDSDLDKDGKSHGAALYKNSTDASYLAIKDKVAVFADNKGQLEGALERREGDDRLREDRFDAALSGLPRDALVRVYGDAHSIVATDPAAAAARKVKWVAALRTFGATASAQRDSVAVDFKLSTDPGGLTEADLPFAGGGQPPPVLRSKARAGEIVAGIRDPSQIVKFAERAGQAVNPAGFAAYSKAKERLSRQLDIDVDHDVIGQFGGNLALTLDPAGRFAFRAELQSPREFERTLRKLARVIPGFAVGAGLGTVTVQPPKRGETFYTLSTPGGKSLVYGVVKDVFVAANDARRAADLAAGSPAAVPGTAGALVANSDAERLANRVLRRLGGALGGLGTAFTGPLGDLTTSIGINTSGIRGSLRLAIQ
jgi:uncharacterized protein DUF3352